MLVVAERPKNTVPFYAAQTPIEDRFKTSFDKNVLGFYFKHPPNALRMEVPFWFILLVGMATGVVPWQPWWSTRFSLRTLFIATTLVAVLLGTIIALIR